MSTAKLVEEWTQTQTGVVPISVDQYHRMIETGILESGAPIELLDGFLIRKDRGSAGADPMTVGNSHAMCIAKLSRLLGGTWDSWHFRPQLPVTLLPDSEPEPDGTIVRGAPEDYEGRDITPADVSCLIEAADSSLRHDRITRLRIYAETGIRQYIIVNLVDDVVEVYSDPVVSAGRYAKVELFCRGQIIGLMLPDGRTFEVAIDRILP